VGVIGNGHAEAMPVVQVNIDGKHQLGDIFFTSERVTKQKDTVEYMCPAQIPRKLSETMKELALRAYHSVDCRDFGRIDFRVDEKGNPYVLEINPLPSLSTEDAFFFIAKAIGINYDEIINKILNAGLARLGLSNGKLKEAK
jgi:D-alanine-D-alanine ligase